MALGSDLRTRNLESLRTVAPQLHDQLSAYRSKTSLVFDAAGVPDVRDRGRSVYGKPVGVHFAEQVASEEGLWRFDMLPPEPGSLDYYGSRFTAEVLGRAAEAGIAFEPHSRFAESYFLVVFGIGLGTHLDDLTEITRCQSLILADTGLDLLYHSTEVYDWHRLIGRLSSRGAKIHFLVSDDYRRIADSLPVVFRRAAPSALDGTTVFMDRSNPDFARAWDRFVGTGAPQVAAVGYFNDECMMLRNTYANLRDGEATVFARRSEATVEVPAFVVASGPSFDRSLPDLKRNAESAVIISCGTALRPLLVNGIVPDIHVEIENIGVLAQIADVADDFDLSRTRLLCSATVERGAPDFFGGAIFFFRSQLSSYHAFCGSMEHSLLVPDPGVANTATSFALETGFRSVYLWGVDLGVKGGTPHHARDSYHFVDGTLGGAGGYDYPNTRPGNFGGEVQTSDFLDHSRANITLAIQAVGTGRSVFNCSDGAAIDGARPTPPDAVELSAPDGGKYAWVERLVAGMPTFTQRAFEDSWREDELLAAIDDVARGGVAVMAADDGSGHDARVTRLMEVLQLEHLFQPPASTSMAHTAASLFRGSLIGVLYTIGYYLNRVPDADRRAELDRIMCAAFAETVDAIRVAAIGATKSIEMPPGPDANDPTLYRDAIPEVKYTWGKVARNAPCPCGSERKFKHCHGRV